MSEESKEPKIEAVDEVLDNKELTNEELEDENLEDIDFSALNDEIVKAKDQLLRLAAEYDNFRKRTTKEKEELAKYGSASVIEKLLPVLDTMDRAIEFNEKSDYPKPAKEGLVKIYQQFFAVLEKEGLEIISGKGSPFDANMQEAVLQEVNDEYPEHTVLEVFEKGYSLKDKVIRYAKVKVSTEG